jgi:pimeloyl-ACP methyl ester carboxylesterase
VEKSKVVMTTIFIILGIGLFSVGVIFVSKHRQGISNAYDRLERRESMTIETSCGQVEYSTHGEGYPVIIVHGIFGGFDQGMVMARGQIGEKFKSIVPSRFGYLGSSMPEDASPESQADMFACVLDALGLDEAAILGTSAGGTSAIQFALRHPDRCSALILVSSNAPGETVGLPPRPVANILFHSDLAFWTLANHFRSTMYTIMGIPEGYELTPQQEMEMNAVIQTVLPVKPRAEGALFDMYISNPAINSGYSIEEIDVPTLIIHAEDDPLARYENIQSLNDQIRGSKMLIFQSGGHPLLGHEAQIRETISGFLTESFAQ